MDIRHGRLNNSFRALIPTHPISASPVRRNNRPDSPYPLSRGENLAAFRRRSIGRQSDGDHQDSDERLYPSNSLDADNIDGDSDSTPPPLEDIYSGSASWRKILPWIASWAHQNCRGHLTYPHLFPCLPSSHIA
jgi:hypothetical protein